MARERSGPRANGPEAKELSRGNSKRPAGRCGSLAFEAPPWTPLGASYVVVQVCWGTGQKVIGVDMTDAQREKADRLAAGAGFRNTQFQKGYIEDVPTEDGSSDAVISKGVINLSLRRGGSSGRLLAFCVRVAAWPSRTS